MTESCPRPGAVGPLLGAAELQGDGVVEEVAEPLPVPLPAAGGGK